MAAPQLFKNVIYNMRKFFHGKTYVLDIGRKPACNTLGELSKIPELAVIMLPPAQSIKQAEACGKKGVVVIG